MNLNRLHEILGKTTIQLRKGEAVEGSPHLVEQFNKGEELTGGGVLEINVSPPVSAARPDLEMVDVEFIVIGVDKARAEQHREELIGILREYPRLKEGPSCIEVGAVIGDQGAAFQLFALGQVLGFWKVITPAFFGFEGAKARQMAGNGLVMITGFNDGA